MSFYEYTTGWTPVQFGSELIRFQADVVHADDYDYEVVENVRFWPYNGRPWNLSLERDPMIVDPKAADQRPEPYQWLTQPKGNISWAQNNLGWMNFNQEIADTLGNWMIELGLELRF